MVKSGKGKQCTEECKKYLSPNLIVSKKTFIWNCLPAMTTKKQAILQLGAQHNFLYDSTFFNLFSLVDLKFFYVIR